MAYVVYYAIDPAGLLEKSLQKAYSNPRIRVESLLVSPISRASAKESSAPDAPGARGPGRASAPLKDAPSKRSTRSCGRTRTRRSCSSLGSVMLTLHEEAE